MLTRAKERNSEPNVFLVHSEPISVKQFITQPEWFSAINVEYESLIKNDTWVLISLHAHRKPIGCKWVFKVKENSYGSINNHKARLVAKGSHQ